MREPLIERSSPIIIVGAGIFGLSTAIHLMQRGFEDVTIFDYQPYHDTLYAYDRGCDGASSDINKFIRAAYGAQSEYQRLAFEAIEQWDHWNDEIRSGVGLPPGMTSADILFVRTGNLSMTDTPNVSDFDLATIANMRQVGKADSQLSLNKPDDVARAKALGHAHAINPFRGQISYGTFDTSAGIVYADKACRFALHKAVTLGVKTVFGPEAGRFAGYIKSSGAVTGIATADGQTHSAELTIMACGGWTPSLVPELDGFCETTAGSVTLFQIPRSSELWDRFAPDRFPAWTYKMRDGQDGGLYGFPRDEHGFVKIGYRGVKFSNPTVQQDGKVRSIPRTRWTENATRQLPSFAASRIKRIVQHLMPELLPYYVQSRLCPYTDSFDNHFVIDFVPGQVRLMVVTAGSGHAFKFLPTIGGAVVDRIEGIANRDLDMWRWRALEAGQKPYNELMQGLESPLALKQQSMTVDDSLDSHYARL